METELDIRKSGIDILRVLASFFVVLIHIANYGNEVPRSANWYAYVFYQSISRWCIPLFFLISGYCLLGRADNVSYILRKIGRLFMFYVVFTIIYAIYNNGGIKGLQLSEIWIKLGDPYFLLWFLPMLIMVYFCAPIVSDISDEKKKYMALCFFCPYLIIQMLMILFEVFEISDTMRVAFGKLWLSYMPKGICYLFLFVVGGEMKNKKWKYFEKVRGEWLAIIIISFTLGIMYVWSYNITGVEKLQIWDYQNALIIFQGILIFKKTYAFDVKNGKLKTVISYLAKASFGCYLIHALVWFVLRDYGYTPSSISSCYFVAIPVYTSIVWGVSIGVSLLVNIAFLRVKRCYRHV